MFSLIAKWLGYASPSQVQDLEIEACALRQRLREVEFQKQHLSDTIQKNDAQIKDQAKEIEKCAWQCQLEVQRVRTKLDDARKQYEELAQENTRLREQHAQHVALSMQIKGLQALNESLAKQRDYYQHKFTDLSQKQIQADLPKCKQAQPAPTKQVRLSSTKKIREESARKAEELLIKNPKLSNALIAIQAGCGPEKVSHIRNRLIAEGKTKYHFRRVSIDGHRRCAVHTKAPDALSEDQGRPLIEVFDQEK